MKRDRSRSDSPTRVGKRPRGSVLTIDTAFPGPPRGGRPVSVLFRERSLLRIRNTSSRTTFQSADAGLTLKLGADNARCVTAAAPNPSHLFRNGYAGWSLAATITVTLTLVMGEAAV